MGVSVNFWCAAHNYLIERYGNRLLDHPTGQRVIELLGEVEELYQKLEVVEEPEEEEKEDDEDTPGVSGDVD